jgi:hypothetical protein
MVPDVLVVAWTGVRPIRHLFERREVAVRRATVAIFILFDANSIDDAVGSMRGLHRENRLQPASGSSRTR